MNRFFEESKHRGNQQGPIRYRDPTDNVLSLVGLTVHRLDDLRAAETRRVDGVLSSETKRMSELMTLRAEHADQLNLAEAKRIDAIRAVDVAAVGVANERATAQAQVLANQVALSAETLRALVASTAAQQAQQLSQLTSQLTDRLASLEKSQYEKQGSSGGVKEFYGWIVGGLIALVAIATFVLPLFKSANP